MKDCNEPRRLTETDRRFSFQLSKCTKMVRPQPLMRLHHKNISQIRAFPDAVVPFVVQNQTHAGDGDKALDGQAGSIGQQYRQSLKK